MNLIRALERGSMFCNCCPWLRHSLTLWISLLCAVFLCASCNSKKYLGENQSFLDNNVIRIKSDDKVHDAAELKEELIKRYKQPEAKGWPIPRYVYYYKYQESLRRRPHRKKWSEERLIKNMPVIHDTLKAEETTEVFESYLMLRGYRTPSVDYKAKTTDKLTTVTYIVDPGPRTHIDTFLIATTDTSLRKIVDSEIENTYFKNGSPLDIVLYNQEKARLVNDFLDEGYARFDETYIAPLEVDTAGGYVMARMRILNESDSVFHSKYYVGTVTVYPDFNVTDTSALYDTLINGVRYITPEPELTLKAEAIERNLFLHQGDLTRKDNFNQTLKNLNRMELIKFVTPEIVVDTVKRDTMQLDTPRINYGLYLTRNKKIALGLNAELTYANISGSNKKSLFGTAANVNYRDLNLFKGAEILNINLDGGVEWNFSKDDEGETGKINSWNMGLDNRLSFPRFMDPFRLYHIIGYSQSEDQPALMGNRLRRWLLYDATTRLNLGFNFVKIQDLYQYYAINSGLSYDIVPDAQRNLTIDRFGFDLFVPTPTDSFKTNVLDKSKFLQESFGKYLFTGLVFRNYLYQRKGLPRRNAGYFGLIHSFEISGLEVLAINRLYNTIAGNEKEFTLGEKGPEDGISNEIRFSHFAKGEVDVRFFYDINSKTQFALRINPGYASPFGGFSRQVPYIKQFFVGGATSNRAWQIRELGPGTYEDTTAITSGFSFYQTGDIKLDMSAELRFPIIWYFEGAVFLDAANVWTREEDPSRPGTKFHFNDFYKELGIGYGFGLRVDLDYFIIRLDFGYKWISPFPLEDGTRTYKGLFPLKPEVQLAVGMPF